MYFILLLLFLLRVNILLILWTDTTKSSAEATDSNVAQHQRDTVETQTSDDVSNHLANGIDNNGFVVIESERL